MAELVKFGDSHMPDFEWNKAVSNGVAPKIKFRPNGLVLPKYAIAEDFSTQGKCTTKRKTLPHIFRGNSGHPVVTQQWRDLIEEVEPGIHGFHEVELLDFKGRPFDSGPYYFFYCMRFVDSIVLQLSAVSIFERILKVNGKDIPYTTNFLKFELDKKTGRAVADVTISSRRVSGQHLWRPAYQLSAFQMFFISDELAASMRKHKINNVRYFSVKEANEDWEPEENLPGDQFEKFTDRRWGLMEDPNIGEDIDEPLRWLMP